MCLACYLIPIGESRLMHLEAAEVPALLDHARADAITTAAAALAERQAEGEAVGQGLPALRLEDNGWIMGLDDRPAPPGGDVIDRALVGAWPIGAGESARPAARFLWAAEVRAVATELRGAVQPQTDTLGCMHGPKSGHEDPGETTTAEYFDFDAEHPTLLVDWSVAGRELLGVDRPTHDRLVAEREVLTDFYEWVAGRGLALLFATEPVGDGPAGH